MNCKKCNNNLDSGDKFCKVCGTPIEDNMPNDISMTPQKGIYEQRPKKKSKLIFLWIFLAIVFVGGIISSLIQNDNDSEQDTLSSTSSKGASASTSYEKEVSEFAEVLDVTNNQWSEIEAKLQACGIDKIKKVERNEAIDETEYELLGYEVDTPNGIVALYIKDGITKWIKYKDEYLYQNGETLLTVQDIINRPDLEVLEYEAIADDYWTYVVGKVRNNTNKTYTYAQISINLYKGSTQVGSTLDNINNLEPGAVWQFKALVTDKDVDQFKIVDVTGF